MNHFLTHLFQSTRGWLARQPLVQRLFHRFPRLSSFLLRRFDTTTFIGLPLTILLLVIAVNAALLSQITEDVVESEGVVHLDKAFTAFLYSMRSEWLSHTFYAFTQLGTREAVFAVGGLATIVFLYNRRYTAVLAFWLTMAGVGLSVQYGKKFISRDRPTEVAFYPEHNFSFPSGHATTSMALWGILAYFGYRHLYQRRLRNGVLVGAGALILLVGFSRIYLGVHFLSDVLAGFLLGAMWVLLGISIVEVMSYLRTRKKLRAST
ncbi:MULTISPECIES: phosphatase PAP2 family protein [Pontibacter]|uniref:Undecaprenyl-diphosphatase n=1 Tax=Pontibacter lucknowensis TaxID=1077936 RepID=A0A1N7B875_9BACT|nr:MULTISPECIES: phosphatase PAP2 family protein [Pontibacter]EJF09742.1 phosphoesterase PA-phosphatase related protein [Pontibacter sp. BAB1700]SIR47561.1 undecaprenyl-diphosphatase [Pontibacter lucknowensis]